MARTQQRKRGGGKGQSAKKGGVKDTPKKVETKKAPVAQKKQKDSKGPRPDPKGMVSADLEVDESVRVTGTVQEFNKRNGNGVAVLSEAIAGIELVRIHYKELQSEDRWPYLKADMEVEFGLKTRNMNGCKVVEATTVTNVGGGKISIQDSDEADREYVGDQNMRFTGHVTEWKSYNGVGKVTMEEGYVVPDDCGAELHLVREEVSCGMQNVKLATGMEVEFGIQVAATKDGKKQYSVYHLTLPGGEVVTADKVPQVEKPAKAPKAEKKAEKKQPKEQPKAEPVEREIFDDVYEGVVVMEKKWARIQVEGDLPAVVTAALKEGQTALFFRQADVEGDKLKEGDKVTCKVYNSSKGSGECEIRHA